MSRLFIRVMVTIIACSSIHLLYASEYLVKYKRPISFTHFRSSSLKVIYQYKKGRFYKVDIDNNDLLPTLQEIQTHADVEYVVANSKFYPISNFYDSNSLVDQWAIKKVEAEAAWSILGNKGLKNIKVAIIDTGADYKHVALTPNMIKGYNFIKNNEDPMDVISYGMPGHGTHCTGIVGASGLVANGTIGMAPVVSLMPLKFIDEDGGDLDNAIRAIDFAIANKIDVISASWSGYMPRANAKLLLEAIERAGKAGIVFVTAASNEGNNNDVTEVYPANANLSNTITVAATDAKDAKPKWSNFGKSRVALAAPGDSIMSTIPGNRYGSISGTSMSAPMVAGLVALIKSRDSQLTPLQIRSLLQASGDKASVEVACQCRINAAKTMQNLVTKKMFISPYAQTLKKGESMQMEVVFGKAPFIFKSSNSNIATIDESGIVTGLSRGNVEISVTDADGTTAHSGTITIAD